MNLLINKVREKTFLKQMNNYVKAIELLESSNKNSNSYQLCFYAGVHGFIDKCFENNSALTDLFFDGITFDNSELLECLYTSDKNNIESYNVNYCYTMGHIIDYIEPKKVLKILLELHLRIYKSLILEQEKRKNSVSKKLFIEMNKVISITNQSKKLNNTKR